MASQENGQTREMSDENLLNEEESGSPGKENNPGDNSYEKWLKLSLSSNGVSNSKNLSKSTSEKVFSCSFCIRKFFSSQALGGHQNAHKRERGTVRKNHFQRTIMGFHHEIPQFRSLGVQAHSIIHKPNRGKTMVARFDEVDASHGMAGINFTLKEAMGLMWQGSFHSHPITWKQEQQQQQQEQPTLDLNLKL